MAYFKYSQAEIDYLKSRDKKLARAIDDIGPIKREITEDLFTAIISSVASQQISSKAAATVWQRIEDFLGEVTPKSVHECDESSLQACGLSFRKTGYIKGVAQAAINGQLDIAALNTMEDDEVIKTLCALNGIGVWTAEMLLIFSLQRRNVLSYGDFAIRRGIMRLYGHKELSRERFEVYRKRYSPYGSIASLYLWELSHD